jgi:hypothetical protein
MGFISNLSNKLAGADMGKKKEISGQSNVFTIPAKGGSSNAFKVPAKKNVSAVSNVFTIPKKGGSSNAFSIPKANRDYPLSESPNPEFNNQK